MDQALTPQRLGWGKRLFPLIVIECYLWGTLVMFFNGPWNWEIADTARLFWFVSLCHIGLAVGYIVVAHVSPKVTRSENSYKKLALASLTATTLLLPLTNYAKTGQFMPDLVSGLRDPGSAYAATHHLAESGTNFAAYLRILASPLLVMLVPVTVFYWSRLTSLHRSVACLAIIGVLAMTLATGQRRDIADFLVTLPILAIASHWAGVTVLSKRSRLALVLGVSVAAAAFMGYFIYSHVSRVGESTAVYAANPATGQTPSETNALLDLLPQETKPGVFAFMNYVTTGYYGLSLALDREWRPMYGAGHSMFLTRNVEKFLEPQGYEARSLPVQISDKDGFRYPVLWCTAYPYFINDLGAFGTMLLMVVLGALLAVSWIDTVGARDPLALGVLWLLVVMAFYLPATNRVLQDGEGVTAFYVLVALYLFYRTRGRTASR